MSNPTVHIIDDDEPVRESLRWLLASRLSVPVETWPSAEAFLAGRPRVLQGCILLDVAMTGMSGLELLERHVPADIPIPVIVLTAHGDVPSAVRAMRGGARMMLEKPCPPDLLVDQVRTVLAESAQEAPLRQRRKELIDDLDTLTPREREILVGFLEGLVTKEIAQKLSISVRTVEVHKSHILSKLGTESMAETVRQLTLHRLDPQQAS